MNAPQNFTPDLSSQKGEGLTVRVAAFAAGAQYREVPEEVRELAKKSILDGFGLAIAGSAAVSGKIVEKHLRALACKETATVIGSNLKTAPRFAAFANGVAIHADDYDDTQLAVGKDRVYGLLTHPTAPALPPALAVAEKIGVDGEAFLLAYHIGVEIESKIAEAISPRHYQHGFHSTGTCGTFAAAAAAGKLQNLDENAMARAMAMAGSQSAGLRENFGTMTKPFHAGRACESGVVAAEFAEEGWTAAANILESPRGFFQAHGGGYDLDAIDGKLGNPWTFQFPGISIKPHPSGSLTHPGMTKMLEMINEHNIRADDVREVRVGTNHNMLNALIHHDPHNELQAKFSMEFCLAILLTEKRANLPEFTNEILARDEVRKMLKRVKFSVHPEAEAAGYDKMTTILEIVLNDGRILSGRADFGKGSPVNPMSYDEVADKFRGCVEFAKFDKERAEKIIVAVRNLEKISDMRELIALLAK
ncbi:MAG: MmgE/PrpD family protein [Gammaproteobacteria bacterium]